MRIPTIFVLIILIFALTFGVSLYILNSKTDSQKKLLLTPIELQLTNITDHQATITWQTKVPSKSRVIIQNKEVQDDRDDQARLTHIVTLKNLSPDTLYNYQVKNDNQVYPDTPQSFKTGPSITEQSAASNFPVLGTIIDQDLQPIDEALVFLKSDGNETLSSHTSTAGNFIVSLASLRTADLKQSVIVNSDTTASLTVIKRDKKSEITFKLPLSNTYLPTVQLGQNIDLTNYTPPPTSSSAFLNPQPSASASASATPNKFDLNNDGKTNVVDLSIILDYVKNKKFVPSADFNNDKKIDQKDIDIIKQQLK